MVAENQSRLLRTQNQRPNTEATRPDNPTAATGVRKNSGLPGGVRAVVPHKQEAGKLAERPQQEFPSGVDSTTDFLNRKTHLDGQLVASKSNTTAVVIS